MSTNWLLKYLKENKVDHFGKYFFNVIYAVERCSNKVNHIFVYFALLVKVIHMT